MNIIQNHSLTNLNTLHLVSLAKYFIKLNDLLLLDTISDFIAKEKIKYLILGGGSNVLLPKYYDGLIILNNLKGIFVVSNNDKHIQLKVMAGESWDDFVKYSVDNKYYGIENLSLIPGSVGASPVQNIGAYGVEVSSVINFVEVYNLKTGEFSQIKNKDCNFKYRYSIFKEQHDYIIVAVHFILAKEKKFNYQYLDLKNKLGDLDSLTIKKIRNTIIQIRSEKLPDWKLIGNVGSFFHNPIITDERLQILLKQYPNLPYYRKKEENLIKVSAGWLIENAGLKGYRDGNVGVYHKQALVLVNYGEAIQIDLLNLAKYIQEKIRNLYNINLIIEPLIVQ